MNRTRRIVPVLALAVLASGLILPASGAEEGFVELFNGKDLKGFVVFPAALQDKGTFSVKDGAITVAGKPNGYFRTEKSYKNFHLKFDWKFTKGGNSGLLVHITGKDQVWPKCVEVQGQQSDHGRIFAIGGAKGKFEVDKAAQKEVIKPGEWNTTEVISEDGKLTSMINGKKISSGTGDLKEGTIGFQSEGTELFFKNIKIKEMKEMK
jgi:hypothetical protein